MQDNIALIIARPRLTYPSNVCVSRIKKKYFSQRPTILGSSDLTLAHFCLRNQQHHIMLDEISWSQFLIAVSGTIGGLYIIILTGLYIHKKRATWIPRRKNTTSLENDRLQPMPTIEGSVLGHIASSDSRTRRELAIHHADASDVIAAPLTAPEEEPTLIVTSSSNERKAYKQLLRDIDTLRSAAIDFSKEECLNMIQIMFQNNSDLYDDSGKDQITEHTTTAFSDIKSFTIKRDEVHNLWPR